jgi:hypothetical protein
MKNPMMKALLPMVRNFVTDEKLGEVFGKLTEGVTPADGEKVALVITQRAICHEQRLFMTVCSVRGMEITQMHRQYSTDDLKKIVENV